MGGPELELGVAGCAELDEVFVPSIVNLDARDRLRVAPIEGFGDAEECGEGPHRAAEAARECREHVVRLLRQPAPVIPRQERDDSHFLRFEPAEVAVLD